MINAIFFRSNFAIDRRRLGLMLGLVLVLLTFYLSPTFVGAFMGIGDYWSEKVVQRQGVTTSYLVASRAGVNGDLQAVMGPIVTTNPVSHEMGSGHTVLSGTLTNLNGFPNADVWFEWGYTTAYGNTVGAGNMVAVGTYTFDLGGVDFGQIIHYRFVGETDGIMYGSDQVITVISTGWYYLAQVLPFIFLAIAIGMVIGLVYAGAPLTYAIIMGAILATVGAVGTGAIILALRALF